MKASVFGNAYVKPAPRDQQARDQLVIDAVGRGEWIRWPLTLIKVPVQGREIGLQVAADYFAVGEPDDYVRVPLGAPAAQAIADKLGAMLPTARMADLIWKAATWRVEPVVAGDIGVAIGAEQESGAACILQSKVVDARLPKDATGLRSGFKKDVIITNRLLDPPIRAPGSNLLSFNRDGVAIYGFWRSKNLGDCSAMPATPGICVVQGRSTVHERSYADYSHGVRLVSNTAFLDGTPVDLGVLLQHPTLSWALSDEGPMRTLRYRDPLPVVGGPAGGLAGGGWCQGFREGPCGGGGALPPSTGGVTATAAIATGAALVLGAGVVWLAAEAGLR